VRDTLSYLLVLGLRNPRNLGGNGRGFTGGLAGAPEIGEGVRA
jgi:hypothetical protein